MSDNQIGRRRISKPLELKVDKTEDILKKQRKEELQKRRIEFEKKKQEKIKELEEKEKRLKLKREEEEKEKEKEKQEQELKKKEEEEKEKERQIIEKRVNEKAEEKINAFIKEKEKEFQDKIKKYDNISVENVEQKENESVNNDIENTEIKTRVNRLENQKKVDKNTKRKKNYFFSIIIFLVVVFGVLFGLHKFENKSIINAEKSLINSSYVNTLNKYIPLSKEYSKKINIKNIKIKKNNDKDIADSNYKIYNQVNLSDDDKKELSNRILENTTKINLVHTFMYLYNNSIKEKVLENNFGTLTIPSLDIKINIINGVNEWNNLYGVSAVLPYNNINSSGNLILSGLNYDSKNVLLSNLFTTDNKIKIKKNDEIKISSYGNFGKIYKVTEIKNVDMNDIKNIDNKEENKLILFVNSNDSKNERLKIVADFKSTIYYMN